jgi:TolA-binding protein
VQADFALGRILAAQNRNDAAVRQFFKVAYGHGGKSAPASYHATQADAIFAAAEVLAASGRQDAARKLYEELLTTYPTSDRATLARKTLDQPLRR